MDALIWTIIGSSAAVVALIYSFLRNFKSDIIQRMDRLEQRIDKLDEKITDIDRRLCRLEGAFSSKDCCRLQDDRNMKQAQ